ncbi:MAG: glycosyltransferase [Betaproteobacteria bacterium]
MIDIDYKLNIICPKDGWIIEKMGLQIHKHLRGSTLYYANHPNLYREGGPLDQEGTINYYLTYILFKGKRRALDAAWFTHIEEDPHNKHIADYFIKAARSVDLAIFNAPKYENQCKEFTKRSATIIPGVDEKFKLKLNLGIVGREYDYTSRKNPELAIKLAAIDWLNIEYTKGEIPEEKLPEFYNRQDYTLVLSKVEGGPMCVLESLAMGKEVIFPRGVGFGEMFYEGLHMYEKDDSDSLSLLLGRLYLQKMRTREIVEGYTWKSFAEAHHQMFYDLIS